MFISSIKAGYEHYRVTFPSIFVPGCTHDRWIDAHHIDHWVDGGETSLDNLILLCSHHHRLVHEGGFSVARRRDGSRYIARPDGRPVEVAMSTAKTGNRETGDGQTNEIRESITAYLSTSLSEESHRRTVR